MDYENFVFSIVKESSFLKFDDNLFMSMVLWMSISISNRETGCVIIRHKNIDKNINFDNYENAIVYIRKYETANL